MSVCLEVYTSDRLDDCVSPGGVSYTYYEASWMNKEEKEMFHKMYDLIVTMGEKFVEVTDTLSNIVETMRANQEFFQDYFDKKEEAEAEIREQEEAEEAEERARLEKEFKENPRYCSMCGAKAEKLNQKFCKKCGGTFEWD